MGTNTSGAANTFVGCTQIATTNASTVAAATSRGRSVPRNANSGKYNTGNVANRLWLASQAKRLYAIFIGNKANNSVETIAVRTSNTRRQSQ